MDVKGIHESKPRKEMLCKPGEKGMQNLQARYKGQRNRIC